MAGGGVALIGMIPVSYTHLDVYKRQGRGYERWATMHNLKQMAATLNVYQEYGFTSPEQLEAAVDTAYQKMRQTSGELDVYKRQTLHPLFTSYRQ